MENENVQLELVDLINAAKIMEHAIKLNVFTVEELVSVAPVVSKFIKFANNALQDSQNQDSENSETTESGDVNE
ncbi:hypothetical protein [Klebsiella phage phiKp_21]|uniref:Uncharacterized protein n=1 Tax=Klebsiella phage vB_KleM_RaK2 TaxID=1147094 RepID=H6X3L2_9CAUD|nr:hypothetical protein F403_gp480 [Klebsiella phage vB_KleM_RaK2]YP_010842945.1 hypothetical protein ACQ27_gp061 [Klebsiella phage K64-1]QOE32465.1 hypothetical protein CPT_Muenster_293 [Klebsiella phage Muenster]UYL05490.1 hypothetical protein DIDNDMLP_00505 [Klebsiella phage KP13-7]BEH88031.1 hypothetical protein [Klebsiella phage phiKp_21]AFA44328.1 hypothetical protein RaK2_00055 [Klebsiella phage vB_KleM_RaK2]